MKLGKLLIESPNLTILICTRPNGSLMLKRNRKSHFSIRIRRRSTEKSGKTQEKWTMQSLRSVSETFLCSLTSVSIVEDKENPFKTMKKNPALFFNLCIVVLAWIAWAFNYFLMNFNVKNLGGNIFVNASLIAIAGITGKVTVVFIRKTVSSKISLFVWLITVFIFGLGLIFIEKGWIVTVCIGFIEVGLGAGIALVFYLVTEYFPPLFVAFAFSVSQFGGKGTTMLSYLLAGLKAPLPSIFLWWTTFVALATLCWLTKPNFREFEESKQRKSSKVSVDTKEEIKSIDSLFSK